jgi:hypothetical protein
MGQAATSQAELSPRTASLATAFSRLSKGSPLPLTFAQVRELLPFSSRAAQCLHELLSTAPSYIQTAKVLT